MPAHMLNGDDICPKCHTNQQHLDGPHIRYLDYRHISDGEKMQVRCNTCGYTEEQPLIARETI